MSKCHVLYHERESISCSDYTSAHGQQWTIIITSPCGITRGPRVTVSLAYSSDRCGNRLPLTSFTRLPAAAVRLWWTYGAVRASATYLTSPRPLHRSLTDCDCFNVKMGFTTTRLQAYNHFSQLEPVPLLARPTPKSQL